MTRRNDADPATERGQHPQVPVAASARAFPALTVAAESDGPFETERDAARAARPVYDLEPGTGAWAVAMHRLLCEACAGAGVELGAHDHAILTWLCCWEPSTVVTIAGWITRAGRAGGGEP